MASLPNTYMPEQRKLVPAYSLPAITVDGHALFEFSLKMNRALKRLETRFHAVEKSPVPFLRQTWQQASRKPR